MAFYINYGEGEDHATWQGAEWLKKFIAHQKGPTEAESFFASFRGLHGEEDDERADVGPVFRLLVDNSDELFGAIPEGRGEDRVKEVESFFALIISLLPHIEEEDGLEKATSRLCDLFSNNAEQHPDLRLRLLMMLYNTFLPSFPLRYRVFKTILDYAAAANMFDMIYDYLEHLEEWMKDWDLNTDDTRVLYRDIAKYLRAMGKRIDAFLQLKRYHSLFQGEEAAVLATVTDSSVQLIRDAIALPSVIQFDDILSFDTVNALSKTKHKELLSLCRVFLQGSVNDLREFHKKNGKLFEEHDLNFQDAMSKIRLLSLATLVHGKPEISLAMVAEALEEQEDKVEPWVVRAISEGVIDGRIDQLNHKVLVKSAFQRTFNKEEWGFLDHKLTNWIDNLESVIKFIGDQKALKAKTG